MSPTVVRAHVALRSWSDAAPLLLHRDAPNEWFFDPDAGELYWFYNATGAPPADLEVAATQLEQLITV